MELEKAEVPLKVEEERMENPSMRTDLSISQRAASGKGLGVYLVAKRCFDIVFSLILLMVLSPVFLIITILVRREDHGPIIHKRRCVSARGTYNMLKFRTMVVDANNLEKYLTPEQIKEYHTNIKLKDDPRITRIGHILRKTSLDELPQLWNILRGEMSFVGPRPVVQEELEYFGEDGELLLMAKPGVTGYWQVHGRGDSTYESGERQKLELYYVKHRGLLMDAGILLRTIPVVLSTRGGVLKPFQGRAYHGAKRVCDVLLSAVLLALLSPVLAVAALLIKSEDGGPVLHRRYCVGEKGKPYIMFKFRTMIVDADNHLDAFSAEQLAQYMQGVKIEDDPRITRIGRVLRSTSIDELPQLLTVLKSDMSLIGPRPVIEREAAAYGEQREKLLSCKPGITGLWQVEGRGTVPYLSEEAKRLQLEYVERQGFMLDLYILIETIKVVLSRKGAR